MSNQIIELFNDGAPERFEHLLSFDYNGVEYAAMHPLCEDEDSVAIFKFEKSNDGELYFSTIDDEDLAKQIFVHFISIWETGDEE